MTGSSGRSKKQPSSAWRKSSPLAADRSEKGLIAAAGKRAERWKRILAESAQQARRLRIPGLQDAEKPCDAFRASAAPLKLLLSERAGARPLREVLEPVASARHSDDVARVAIAIGPEGGWTDAEFASAATCGFVEVALGANILRTETAVCAALAAVQYAFGAFRPNDLHEIQEQMSCNGLVAQASACGVWPCKNKPHRLKPVLLNHGECMSGKDKDASAEWDANLYNAKHDFVWKYGSDVVSLLDPRAGERILDLGCGTGHLTAQIAESGAQVMGVDRSAEMVAAARLAYPNLKFEISDARGI